MNITWRMKNPESLSTQLTKKSALNSFLQPICIHILIFTSFIAVKHILNHSPAKIQFSSDEMNESIFCIGIQMVLKLMKTFSTTGRF